MTTSTIVARVEELIRRAEALDQGGASERSRALATRLRSTVLRPLADLGDTLDRTTEPESQTAGVQELLFELAVDLTRRVDRPRCVARGVRGRSLPRDHRSDIAGEWLAEIARAFRATRRAAFGCAKTAPT
jgi:hypothetical protein